MSQKRWSWLCLLIALASIALLKGEWFTGLTVIAVTIFYLVCWLRSVRMATVTGAGIAVENGPVIPFKDVARIVREGAGIPLQIFTVNGEAELNIPNRDLIKLARTILNRWSVEGEKVTVTAGGAGQELQIHYAPRGKYCTYRDKLESWAICIFSVALFLNYLFNWDYLIFIVATAAGYLLFFKFPIVFREVEMSVLGDTILLKDENLVEHSLRFSDIASIEQTVFRVKVTAKDGKEVYFPQGFVLLPELIEEFAGL